MPQRSTANLESKNGEVSGLIEIALCDDSAEDIGALKGFAERFAAEHPEYPIRIQAFYSGTELLEYIENNGGFDLYILDVVMPKLSGIELAEAIRGRGERAEIVFLTFSREYAVDAFGVKASGYMIKPVEESDFDNELLCAIKKLIPEKNDAFTVKTKDGMRKIQLQKLVMIESFNHTRVITMSDDSELETSATLSELFERLSGYENFYMPHRAYIVNLDYSTGITRYDLIMLGDRRIPIPRKQYSVIQELFSNYFFK